MKQILSNARDATRSPLSHVADFFCMQDSAPDVGARVEKAQRGLTRSTSSVLGAWGVTGSLWSYSGMQPEGKASKEKEQSNCISGLPTAKFCIDGKQVVSLSLRRSVVASLME